MQNFEDLCYVMSCEETDSFGEKILKFGCGTKQQTSLGEKQSMNALNLNHLNLFLEMKSKTRLKEGLWLYQSKRKIGQKQVRHQALSKDVQKLDHNELKSKAKAIKPRY